MKILIANFSKVEGYSSDTFIWSCGMESVVINVDWEQKGIFENILINLFQYVNYF